MERLSPIWGCNFWSITVECVGRAGWKTQTGNTPACFTSLLLIYSGSLACGSQSLRVFPNTSRQAAMTNQRQRNEICLLIQGYEVKACLMRFQGIETNSRPPYSGQEGLRLLKEA